MKILDFIDELRSSDRYIREIYLYGGCYRFHLVLKKMYPTAVPYISDHKNHIVTKYRGRYYDIMGELENVDGYTVLTPSEQKMAEQWSFYKNNLIKLNECPSCEEPLVYFEQDLLKQN